MVSPPNQYRYVKAWSGDFRLMPAIDWHTSSISWLWWTWTAYPFTPAWRFSNGEARVVNVAADPRTRMPNARGTVLQIERPNPEMAPLGPTTRVGTPAAQVAKLPRFGKAKWIDWQSMPVDVRSTMLPSPDLEMFDKLPPICPTAVKAEKIKTDRKPAEPATFKVNDYRRHAHMGQTASELADRFLKSPIQRSIFVYGSLKKGYWNNILLSGNGAEFVSARETRPEFTMRDLGQFPGILRGGKTTIKGELYRVNDTVLQQLDRLEGHPGFYRRETIALENGELVETYVLPSAYRDRGTEVESGEWVSEKGRRVN